MLHQRSCRWPSHSSKQCSTNSARHSWEVRAAFKRTNAHARIRQCFSLPMSGCRNCSMQSCNNDACANISRFLPYLISSKFYDEFAVTQTAATTTTKSLLFVSFFFVQRNNSKFICEPPRVHFIYSKTIPTLFSFKSVTALHFFNLFQGLYYRWCSAYQSIINPKVEAMLSSKQMKYA